MENTLRIYQIDSRKDKNGMLFMPYNKDTFDFTIYKEMWCDEAWCCDGKQDDMLGDVYIAFNLYKPKGFCGHSLSVSDIVRITNSESDDYYYCDRIDWKKIDIK